MFLRGSDGCQYSQISFRTLSSQQFSFIPASLKVNPFFPHSFSHQSAVHSNPTKYNYPMHNTSELDQQASSQSSAPNSNPNKAQLALHHNYHQMESQQQSNHHDAEYPRVLERPQHQEIVQLPVKFKLLLPSPEVEKEQPQRNMLPKNKRVKIDNREEVKEVRVNKNLKIVDLEDDVQEEIITTNFAYVPPKISEEAIAYKQPYQVDKEPEEEQYNNSYMEVQDNGLVPDAIKNQLHKRPRDEENGNEDAMANNSTQLFVKSKIPAKLTKNALENYEKEQFVLGVQQSSSKNSLDTGLQVNTLTSSRDELSTRNMYNFPDKSSKRQKLPALQPYKNMAPIQAMRLPSQSHLNEQKSQKSQRPAQIIKYGQILIRGYEITNVPQFVKSKVPYGKRLECYLRRNKTCSKRFFLDYDLQTTDGRFLLSCKKMPFCLSSTYHLSLAKDAYSDKSQFFLAKAEGNFSGSIFNVYKYDFESYQPKEMVATICYTSKCTLCTETFREMEIYLLNEDFKFFELEGFDRQNKNLKDLYEIQSNRTLKINKLINKPPKWNPKHQIFTLNFHGKSKLGSVKNTIIVQENAPERDLLLLAKQDSDTFAFDICYPFTPLAAFGLMITGFDFKLASQ